MASVAVVAAGLVAAPTPGVDADAAEPAADTAAASGSTVEAPGWFRDIVAGAHTCAIAADATAWCWGGNNEAGQLGRGVRHGHDAVVTPAPVADVDGRSLRFTSLAVSTWEEEVNGRAHTCGITTAGDLWCWGNDRHGQLGDGGGEVTRDSRFWCASSDRDPTPYPGCEQLAPTPVDTSGLPEGTRFVDVAAGGRHTCALSEEGDAWCWGAAYATGTGPYDIDVAYGYPTPRRVETDVRFRALAAGLSHTCGVTLAGDLHCWGVVSSGELAWASTVPTPVGEGATFTAVSAGRLHVCALTDEGAVLCWGGNGSGQLGDGTTTARSTLTPVEPDEVFAAVDAGAEHTCALTVEGEAVCWGSDDDGALGEATDVRLVSVDAGTEHTCGLDRDGGAWCWGLDWWGHLGDGGRVVPGPECEDFAGRPVPDAPDDCPRRRTPQPVPVGLDVAVDDVTAAPGETVTFSATATGLGPVTYRWALDGEPLDGVDGPTLTRTVAEGDHGREVSVHVTNAFAAAASDRARVRSVPTADPGGPYTAAEGDRVTLDATGSGDLDGEALAFAWDLTGDGRYDDATGSGPVLDLTATDGPATRTVAVRVTDEGGRSDLASTTVAVANVAPMVTAADVHAEVGTPTTITATFRDPGAADTHTATVDLGDGTVAAAPAPVDGTVAVDHTYAAAGSYPVTVTVEDDDGGSGSTTLTVTVAADDAPGDGAPGDGADDGTGDGPGDSPGDGPGDGPAVGCPAPPVHAFPDTVGSVHAAAIACLADLGLLDGHADGTFRPAAPVTRAQAATVVHGVLEHLAPGTACGSGGAFADVSALDPHADAIACLAALDVVAGYPDGTFRPRRPVTRGQAASLVARLSAHLGADLPDPAATFTDVAADGAHGLAIGRLHAAGVLEGYEDGAFRPGRPVTRGQVASVVQRFLARVADA